MASKLQVFKVWPCRDLNLGLLHESISLCKVTHEVGPGSNPGVPQLWRLVTLKPSKLQQCTLHFWTPLIFFNYDKRGQERSYMFIYDMLSGISIGLLHKIANDVYLSFRECDFNNFDDD